jgi:type II secretory pathway pseudopilin PulG
MIKLFRNIRKNLIAEGKTTKYFKYAIGEIVLVVIGILIALSINNWNEQRKQKKQLDAIYTTVQQNLKTDLNNLKVPIDFFETLDSTLTNILTTNYSTSFLDSINGTNYLECIPCKSSINYYESFEKQDNGFELLKKYQDNESIKGNEFSQDIIQFYTVQGNGLTTFRDLLIKEAYSNLKYYEQFPWYSDYSLGNYNPEAIAYFLNDQTYKNKAANFKIFIGRNYLKNLKDYEASATDFISKIEKRRKALQ